MPLSLYLFVFLSVTCVCCCQAKKVAIIGAGIGGASASYFMKQRDQSIEIDLYEKNTFPGGRVQEGIVDGVVLELGGSLFTNESNLQMYSLAEQFFSTYCPFTQIDDSNSLPGRTRFGVHSKSGIEIEFGQSSSGILDTIFNSFSFLKSALRFGIPLSKLNSIVSQVESKLVHLHVNYTPLFKQEDPACVQSLKEFLVNNDLEQYGFDRIEHYLASNLDSEVLKILVEPSIRAIYNQDSRVTTLPGLVSLIPNPTTAYSVLGGNRLLVEKLIELSKANFLVDNPVSDIHLLHDGSFSVQSKSLGKVVYDAVVIATPLELADITLHGFQILSDRKFKTTHVSFVSAQNINDSYFNMEENETPQSVFTTRDTWLPFSSLSSVAPSPVVKGNTIFKIFSDEMLSEDVLNTVFINMTSSFHHKWEAAYPDYRYLPERHPEFNPVHNLYYLNSFESLVSVMEVSTLAAYYSSCNIVPIPSQPQNVQSTHVEDVDIHDM